MRTYLLAASVAGSHYRGGTYQFSVDNGQLKVTTTQTWRDEKSGYTPKCTQHDVKNQIPSNPQTAQKAVCALKSNQSSCGTQTLDYTVTFVGDDYCYGDGVDTFALPKESFSFGWTSCCWVNFQTDSGATVNGGSMIQIASINDTKNNSPVFKHPPLWMIMSGCDGQKIDLNPSDPDNDVIKCRWATKEESLGAHTDLAKWPSLSLDKENCIVTYTGSMDGSNVGVKPISIMMEDFDRAGKLRSSVPVQFLARVWTPDLTSRLVGIANYPDWFGEHHEDDDDKKTSQRELLKAMGKYIRGRRSVPDYCTSTPEQGSYDFDFF